VASWSKSMSRLDEDYSGIVSVVLEESPLLQA
jgi:hypothetical protein